MTVPSYSASTVLRHCTVCVHMWQRSKQDADDCSRLESWHKLLSAWRDTRQLLKRIHSSWANQNQEQKPLPESIAQSCGRTTAPHRSITQSQRILVLPGLIFSIMRKDSCSSQVNFSMEGRCDCAFWDRKPMRPEDMRLSRPLKANQPANKCRLRRLASLHRGRLATVSKPIRPT